MPPDVRVALRTVCDRLRDLEEPWRVTASAATALHGAARTPRDLDVETTRAGAVEIAQRLAEFVREPLRLGDEGLPDLVSDFARYEVDGVTVEVMGDLRTRAADGSWRTPLIGRSATDTIDGMPVASLDALEQFYGELGRTERVELVRGLRGP